MARAVPRATRPAPVLPRATSGALLVLLSAAGFGAMAIFGKLAYQHGVSTTTLLLTRFALGTAIFTALLAATRTLRRPPLRTVVVGLGLGAVGYATQAGLYFAALHRLDASLLALVLYTYPAWVTAAGFALGRDRPTPRRLVALGLASAGLVVVLATAAGGAFDWGGIALGLGAALAYTGYILTADATGVAVVPLELSALVCAGATVTFAVLGTAGGAVDLGLDGDAWWWLACIAVVSTALPIAAFFAGLDRVGPSAASILSTFEPVVTVTLAFLVFDETLRAVQLGGAALVLAAAVVLALPGQAPAARSSPTPRLSSEDHSSPAS